jgi:hypothetical protein
MVSYVAARNPADVQVEISNDCYRVTSPFRAQLGQGCLNIVDVPFYLPGRIHQGKAGGSLSRGGGNQEGVVRPTCRMESPHLPHGMGRLW